MSSGDYEVPLSLSVIDGGKLEEDFQVAYRAVIANLRDGEKAGITITIELSRVKNTTTMINMDSKLAMRLPPRKSSSACQITGDGKQLLAEKPIKENVKVVSMFGEKGIVTSE